MNRLLKFFKRLWCLYTWHRWQIMDSRATRIAVITCNPDGSGKRVHMEDGTVHLERCLRCGDERGYGVLDNGFGMPVDVRGAKLALANCSAPGITHATTYKKMDDGSVEVTRT